MKEPTIGLLEELAVRCEIVSGPDRVLDGEICLALGLANGNVRVDERTGWVVGGNTPLPVKPLEYTRSVDDALSTLPYGLRLAFIELPEGAWEVCDIAYMPEGVEVHWEPTFHTHSDLARAIVLCTLRARHALALSEGSDT